MTVTLRLPPDIERALLAEAEVRGISIDDMLETLLRQFAAANRPPQPSPPGSERNLIRLEDGMWVLRTGETISAETVNETIQAIRRSRDLANFGPSS